MIVFHLASAPVPPGERAVLTARKELLSYLPRTLYAYNGGPFILREILIDGRSKISRPMMLTAFAETYGPMHDAIGVDWVRAGGDFEIVIQNDSSEPRGFFAAWGCHENAGTMGEAIDRYEEFLRTGRILPDERGRASELAEGQRQLPAVGMLTGPEPPRATRVRRALRKGGGR